MIERTFFFSCLGFAGREILSSSSLDCAGDQSQNNSSSTSNKSFADADPFFFFLVILTIKFLLFEFLSCHR